MRNIIIMRSFIFLNRKIRRLLLLLVTIFLCVRMMGETIISDSISNPIRTGFHPDPSICRVGEDYYLVTSSFTWFPGLPIYHSRDLTNWSLIGHALTNPKAIDFNGMTDNDGIWAPTLRYHNGTFYLITTAHGCGGNFYMTAKNPAGPWSDPVWLKDAPGIDPSLFFDVDGRCYYTGNRWDFKSAWPAQCAVWMQELDLQKRCLVGERKTLAYGHAANAKYAEGPHLYKIEDHYLLLMAEGGSDYNHAVTALTAKSLWGPYVPCTVNPVLTHRHLGKDYPVQSLGHADLVQTPTGDWYAVFLGKRIVEGGLVPLGRETFLCEVSFQKGEPIFNPGIGVIGNRLKRPPLPWTPVSKTDKQNDFESSALSPEWATMRVPKQPFHHFADGNLFLSLRPEMADSLVCPSMLLRRVHSHNFSATTTMSFSTRRANEWAGLVLYRTAKGYYSLLKGKNEIRLTKVLLGKKTIIATLPWKEKSVILRLVAKGATLTFYAGLSNDMLYQVGEVQSVDAVSDNKVNRFNGTGVGIYATSNGKQSINKASYQWFEYKEE